ncbi:hypothetical protein R84981_000193 [Carnimonas sp. R-84981]|uniref:HlyD family secretion protein n=1 Tax=Carnimonas bestiolae TaxID=3402172 RepID=UPI003EDBF09E
MPESDPNYTSPSNEPQSGDDAAVENRDEGDQKGGGNGKKKRIRLLILIVLIVAIIAGLILAHSADNAPLEGIVDTDEINVTSKVTSRVSELLVHEGDSVTEGQMMAFMTDPQTSANQLQATHQLERAQAAKDRSDNGQREEDIRSLKSQWLSAQSDERLANISADRAIELHRRGAVSTQNRDDAVARRDAARQQTQSTHQQYLEAVRGDREEDRRIAASDEGVAQASLESATSLVKEMNVAAPVDGEVAKRFANQGELIGAGTPLFSMIDLNNLWVTVNLREDRFNSLKMGDKVTGHIPALGDKQVEFKVTFINPKASFATWRATRQASGYDVRTFEVRLRSLEAVDGMRPGMTVLYDWPPHHD